MPSKSTDIFLPETTSMLKRHGPREDCRWDCMQSPSEMPGSHVATVDGTLFFDSTDLDGNRCSRSGFFRKAISVLSIQPLFLE